MQAILVVWLAVLLEKLIPVSSSIDPLSFFRFVCQQMANKVLKNEYTGQQLIISGSLALLMLTVPVLIITYLLHAFASYQWLLDTLILWLLIQYTQDLKLCNKALAALNANKKQLSKDLLQQKLLRNTSQLSPLGLTKACLETVFLRYHHQQFTTIVCYLVLGPIFTIFYRLCYEAHQVWNVKLTTFKIFGRFANTLTLFFQLLPSVLMGITFLVTSSPLEFVSACKRKQFWYCLKQVFTKQNIHSLLLYSLSNSLKVNTGGPVMYGHKKYQRPRFTHLHAQEPSIQSLKTLITLVNRNLILCLLVVTWIIFWPNLH
jgi:adenosylcobinamide-phosphate synthase